MIKLICTEINFFNQINVLYIIHINKKILNFKYLKTSYKKCHNSLLNCHKEIDNIIVLHVV